MRDNRKKSEVRSGRLKCCFVLGKVSETHYYIEKMMVKKRSVFSVMSMRIV